MVLLIRNVVWATVSKIIYWWIWNSDNNNDDDDDVDHCIGTNKALCARIDNFLSSLTFPPDDDDDDGDLDLNDDDDGGDDDVDDDGDVGVDN